MFDPENFQKEKKDLQDEWTELGVLIHEVLDNGVPVDLIHDFVDKIFAGNMELMWFEYNGRMND